MIKIDHAAVEDEIIKAVKEFSNKLNLEVVVDSDCSPGNIIGMSSQVLITVMGKIEEALDVSIPDTCYIFHDKVTKRQLTIKEAADKLIKIAKDGK